MKILMIGGQPPPIGGITVSFKGMVDLLKQHDEINVLLLDLNSIRNRRINSILKLLILFREIITKSRQSDIITVYFASTAIPTLGLLLLIISRLTRKPLIIRKGAGFDYYELGVVRGFIAHMVIKKVDLYLAETKKLVRLAQKRGISRVKWFPTNRIMSCDVKLSDMKSCRRFVFIGQVREYKGLSEIVKAVELIKEDIIVDVYGPLFDDLNKNIFENSEKVRYLGVLSPEGILDTLKNYDMLLLPTKADTEGYPGAVFEAYSSGLPIITTRCGGITEIVDKKSGIFVEPGNYKDLSQAMQLVINDDKIYHELRRGVFEKRKKFDSNFWTNKFLEYCQEVISRKHESIK